ncbi:response regulator [Geomobilimonas luticola]|uniref:Response regulator n=1 Tax=Geomobilimonas luticola TaxID=1114878 RepID=A0ABS5SBJ6_9BACT|nr:response regulator [Geomobilimonas luticola]MBT0652749.1 response regulator [Geomobilimonas luticola]
MTVKKQLGDLLVEAGIITVKTLERALDRQKGSGKRLGLVLEEMGVITDEELVDALAQQFGFKTVKGFSGASFSQDLLDLVPEDLAVQKQLFPIKEKDGMLAIAVTDPFDNDTFDFLAKKSGKKIFPVLATRQEVGEALKKHYLRGKETGESKTRILVIDDSQPIATIIQVALQKEGYEVEVAHDGLDGLKMALTNRPDLIICDSVMPRMDGYGLMRAIKGNPAVEDIPMILLTSKASGEDEQKALETGFIDFIPKPVQPIRVVSRVKRALDLLKKFK